jgi:uncharacterized membrane protein YhaH (DUF805 family)
MDLMFQPLRKYADFSGRARRSEFWLFALLVFGIEIVFWAILSAVGGAAMMSGDPEAAAAAVGGTAMIVVLLFGVVMLGLLIPSIAVTFRRLHDTNRSAWWILIGLIPLLGALVLLVFYLLDGTPGPNRFGPDPKDRAATGAAPAAA